MLEVLHCHPLKDANVSLATSETDMKSWQFRGCIKRRNLLLHGTSVAMYISGQERRLVDPPSQVVAGVRTVTTKNEWARTLPRSRPFAFISTLVFRHSVLPPASVLQFSVYRGGF